jgi:hypothetical protein
MQKKGKEENKNKTKSINIQIELSISAFLVSVFVSLYFCAYLLACLVVHWGGGYAGIK